MSEPQTPDLAHLKALAEEDEACQHGTALDVHCCNCHGGFLFDVDACVCVFDVGDGTMTELKELAEAASRGVWTACRITHHERGDDLTPEEIGQYTANSVIKSRDESGSSAFLFVSVEKPDGPADVCLVGNGPTSAANAAYIAAVSPDVLLTLLASLTQKDEEIAALKEVLDDKRRLAREIGIALDGVERAAKQPSLCDLVAPISALRAERDALKAENERLKGDLDVLAERRREISDLLADAGVPGGTTLYGGVLMLRERAEKAEASLAMLTEEHEALKKYITRRRDIAQEDSRNPCFGPSLQNNASVEARHMQDILGHWEAIGAKP